MPGGQFGGQLSGGFAGRGPKGYTRSDERIREDVSDKLMEHPDLDASEIEVQIQNREVTLTGTVRSEAERTRAVQLASARSGVDFAYLMAKASAESGLDASAQAKTSTATGLFQFTEGTWLSMVREHGAKYGLGRQAEKLEALGRDLQQAGITTGWSAVDITDDDGVARLLVVVPSETDPPARLPATPTLMRTPRPASNASPPRARMRVAAESRARSEETRAAVAQLPEGAPSLA